MSLRACLFFGGTLMTACQTATAPSDAVAGYRGIERVELRVKGME